MPIRRLTALFCLLLIAAACSSGSGDDPTPTPASSIVASAPPVSGPIPTDPAEGEINKPKSGAYTYELRGESGFQGIPEGTTTTETISVEGDIYTSVISNNQNDNTATVKRQWQADKIVRLQFASKISGTTHTCDVAPPIVILKIPVKEETFGKQTFESANCDGSVEIRVISRELVEDANRHAWATWKIEEREKATVPAGAVDRVLTRWFSPALGVDIRTRDVSGTRTTATILRSHP